ncbi:MAG: TolC family protein [Bacteroidetes bacterium]|nr:TolC family protein [Bacteroidota bacterium]
MKKIVIPKLLFNFCFLLFISTTSAQHTNSISLEECYQLAQSNYPLIRLRELIDKTTQYNIDNITRGVYPQFNVNGAATYQSDVTKIDIKIPGYNVNIPAVSKDQYKLYGEVSQTLTDFGINKQRRQISAADAAVQQENLNTQLYALKDRINQIYFGILLINGQLEQNELSKQDIQTGINNVQARIDNGTDFKSSLNKLKAQLLQTSQRDIDLKASRKAYTDMLSLFINKIVDDSTVLEKPVIPQMTDSINRPELSVYNLQAKEYLQQEKLTKENLYPKLDAFFQGGMGKPSPVNFLSTNLSGYYITGLRLSWNIGALYTYKKDLLINKNNRDVVETNRNTFLFNTQLTLKQQNADIERYEALIQSDIDIIKLRESVKQSSQAQLQNGVISANDFLTDVNAEAEARQNKSLHEIQLLMSQYNHKTTAGN